jgi:hypothetical protein
MRVLGSAARGDHYRGNAALKQIEGMIEPGPQNRRWMPGILSRTEYNQRVCMMQLLGACSSDDQTANCKEVNAGQNRRKSC